METNSVKWRLSASTKSGLLVLIQVSLLMSIANGYMTIRSNRLNSTNQVSAHAPLHMMYLLPVRTSL